jgi:hypothetical protein
MIGKLFRVLEPEEGTVSVDLPIRMRIEWDRRTDLTR